MLGRLLGWSRPKVAAEPIAWELALSGEADVLQLRILRKSKPATFAQVICAWSEDADFRFAFSETLKNCKFTAFRWELPRLTSAFAQRPFECALIDSPSLLVSPNPQAFAAHFSEEKEVVTFKNLGGDATMVVPCPLGPDSGYGHLRAFLKSAPDSQKHRLWEAVGQQMHLRLGAEPVWLNTAGGGVPWLHIRLDDRPKYYRHEAYQ